MIFIHILLGGFASADGPITSACMYGLARQLRTIPNAQVEVMPWGEYKKIEASIRRYPKMTHVGVGYSGGSTRLEWLANMPSHPPLGLLVLYDPSPKWQTMPIPRNVKQTIAYRSLHPMFLGLGAGETKGHNVKQIDISENHALVQCNSKLHRITYNAISKLGKQQWTSFSPSSRR